MTPPGNSCPALGQLTSPSRPLMVLSMHASPGDRMHPFPEQGSLSPTGGRSLLNSHVAKCLCSHGARAKLSELSQGTLALWGVLRRMEIAVAWAVPGCTGVSGDLLLRALACVRRCRLRRREERYGAPQMQVTKHTFWWRTPSGTQRLRLRFWDTLP